MSADCIAVLQDGRLAEVGSYRELMAGRGKYYELWLRQAPAFGWVTEGEVSLPGPD